MAKRRPNHDGSIARWQGRWRALYTDPATHKQRAVYGITQEECKCKLDEALTAIRTGVYVQPDKTTVEAWLTFWFEQFYRRSVKPSTAATTWGNIRAKLIPALGAYPLQKLSTLHVQAFVTAELDAGRSVSTIRRYLKVLNQALTQARELQRMNTDPIKGVKLPAMEKPEIQFLTRDEQALFLSACPSSTSGRALRFLLGTGLRVSELCGLQWQDIQEDGLHIERSTLTLKDWQEDGYTFPACASVTSTPKTHAGKRVIPLTPYLRGILEEQRSVQLRERLKAGSAWAGGSFSDKKGYIFATRIGHPQDRHNLNRAFRSILNKCELPPRGVHSLRHTFATNWVQRNPDVVALSRILGHTDPAFTYKTYCHAEQRSMNQGMAAMEVLLQSLN